MLIKNIPKIKSPSIKNRETGASELTKIPMIKERQKYKKTLEAVILSFYRILQISKNGAMAFLISIRYSSGYGLSFSNSGSMVFSGRKFCR